MIVLCFKSKDELAFMELMVAIHTGFTRGSPVLQRIERLQDRSQNFNIYWQRLKDK